MHRGLSTLVILIVVFAGCSGAEQPTTTGPDATTSSPTPDNMTTTGFETGSDQYHIGFDPSRVGRDIANQLDVPFTRATITIRNETTAVDTYSPDSRSFGPIEGVTLRRLGFRNATYRSSGPVGGTVGRHVTLAPGDASSDELEHVYAHEYVHVLQFTTPDLAIQQDGDRIGSADYAFTTAAIQEGIPVVVADRYARRHGLDVQPEFNQYRELYQREPPVLDLFSGRYYFGARYVQRRLAMGESVADIVASPPDTSEELIHGPDAANTSVKPIDIVVSIQNDSWEKVYGTQTGEFFTRTVLDTELSSETATRAAAGWGNDRFYRFDSEGGDVNYIWVHRWETRKDQSEFIDAAAVYSEKSQTKVEVIKLGENVSALIINDGTDSKVSFKTE